MIFIGVVFLALFDIFFIYGPLKKSASNLDPEVRANVVALGTMIRGMENGGQQYRETPKFSTSAFKNNTNTFGLHEIDGQAANFYVNLERIDQSFEIADLQSIQSQGLDILNKLNYFFGTSSHIEYDDMSNVVSQDLAVPTLNLMCYFRYRIETIRKLAKP